MPNVINRADRERQLAILIAELLRDEGERYDDGRGGNWSIFESRLREGIAPELADLYRTAAMQLAAEQGILLDEEVLDVEANAWAGNYSGVLAGEITNNTINGIASANGLASVGQIDAAETANRISRQFDQERADKIGATEVTRASTAGENGAARKYTEQTGLVLIPIWNCEEGACPICEPLDGQPFEVWGDEFPSGPPEPHPWCRCYLTWELAGGPLADAEESEDAAGG